MWPRKCSGAVEGDMWKKQVLYMIYKLLHMHAWKTITPRPIKEVARTPERLVIKMTSFVLSVPKLINRLKAEAKDLSQNKPSIKPEAAGRGFYARFISR